MSLILLGTACWSFYRSSGVGKESQKRFAAIYCRFKWYAPVMVSDPPGLCL